MGLVLGRKKGESIFIGKDIKVTLKEIDGNQVKIDIDAPQNVNILREEVKKRNEANGQNTRV